MKVDIVRSIMAQFLPRLLYSRRRGPQHRIWRVLHRYYSRGRLPIKVFLHGKSMFLNPASPYPFILADAPQFNSGLIAVAICLYRHVGRPLHIVDVGSSVGDTLVLLKHSIPDGIESCICVDGAEDNRPYFEKNTVGINGVRAYFMMLGAAAGAVPSLVRHHPGSAMAAGSGCAPCQTLDSLLATLGPVGKCDLIKIDVDGYDGEVLKGAGETLLRWQPLVVFEWHPYLIKLCGCDHRTAFRALGAAGYRKLIWFNNRGYFSHISEIPDEIEINWWNEFLISRYRPDGPHFDVVALPPLLENLVADLAGVVAYSANVTRCEESLT